MQSKTRRLYTWRGNLAIKKGANIAMCGGINISRIFKVDPDDFFSGYPPSKRLFDTVYREVESLGEMSIRVTKSQIAFRRKRNFAMVWLPGQYLRGKTAPLVLTIALRRRDTSPRWKEIVEPVPGRFTHHLELHHTTDIDDEVRSWLREAWELT